MSEKLRIEHDHERQCFSVWQGRRQVASFWKCFDLDARRRAELYVQAEANREAIAELLAVGDLMSNICHNFAQDSRTEGAAMTPHTRAQLKQLQRRWDEASAALKGVPVQAEARAAVWDEMVAALRAFAGYDIIGGEDSTPIRAVPKSVRINPMSFGPTVGDCRRAVAALAKAEALAKNSG